MKTTEEVIEIFTPKVEIKPSDSLTTKIIETIQSHIETSSNNEIVK